MSLSFYFRFFNDDPTQDRWFFGIRNGTRFAERFMNSNFYSYDGTDIDMIKALMDSEDKFLPSVTEAKEKHLQDLAEINNAEAFFPPI